MTTIIDDSKFKPSYQILGKKGGAITQGVLSLSKLNDLSSLSGVAFTVWEISPDGKDKNQIDKYQFRFTSIKASYFGETEEDINKDNLDILLDGNVVPLNRSINVSVLGGGYSEVKIKSNGPITSRNNKNNDRVRVSVVGVFENKIE
ncbi:hypothetical protein [Vibrio harveyi]|uniref:hypothetical protein n=1 Tax=Vibrio harveyi TaxID=669 RepID=UPI000FDC3EE2|nr:hypothetical protein [Vibrio harveyi]ELV8773740.1 hypothetical protein [Vibrio harveyi]